MLVSFWSVKQGQSCVTTNMISLSLALSMSKNLKTLVTHTQFGEISLERALLPETEEYLGGSLSNYGMEPVLRLEKNYLLNVENFSDYTIPLLKNNRYDLLIGTRSHNLGESEKNNYEDTILSVLKLADKKYDLTFVDLTGGLENELSKRVIMLSDLVIVNISQNDYFLEKLKEAKFLKNIEEKIIYCFGRYDSGIKSNLRNLSRKYKLKKVIAVPYSSRLIDVINRGEVVEYFGRSIVDKKKAEVAFFKDLLKSAEHIAKRLDA